MRMRLRIPQVKPEIYREPEVCPYEGCGGRHFKVHEQRCPKPLRDPKHDLVIAKRLYCVRCGRSFRVYPQGVTRANQSQALCGLSVFLYVLGLSYGGVADLLEAFSCPLGKTRVYYNVQAAGKRAIELREAWLKAHRGPVRVMAADLTRVQCQGDQFVVGVVVDDESGVELSVDVLDGEDAATLEKWLKDIAKALGAEVLVSDDADAFKIVADNLGLGHQVCRAHVNRHVMERIAEFGERALDEARALPAGLVVNREQLLDDLVDIEEIVLAQPHNGVARLEQIHRRYAEAEPPREGGKASLWYQLRLWTLDIWNNFDRFRLYRSWRGDEGERMDGTSNSVERAIGWWVKERYRTMRGYKRKDSVRNVSSLLGWLGGRQPDYDLATLLSN